MCCEAPLNLCVKLILSSCCKFSFFLSSIFFTLDHLNVYENFDGYTTDSKNYPIMFDFLLNLLDLNFVMFSRFQATQSKNFSCCAKVPTVSKRFWLLRHSLRYVRIPEEVALFSLAPTCFNIYWILVSLCLQGWR